MFNELDIPGKQNKLEEGDGTEKLLPYLKPAISLNFVYDNWIYFP